MAAMAHGVSSDVKGVFCKSSVVSTASPTTPNPTQRPTPSPSAAPTSMPTEWPTQQPTSGSPTAFPTFMPSTVKQYSSLAPTVAPTLAPSWLVEWGVIGDCFDARRHEAHNWTQCLAAYKLATGTSYSGAKSSIVSDDFPSRYQNAKA